VSKNGYLVQTFSITLSKNEIKKTSIKLTRSSLASKKSEKTNNSSGKSGSTSNEALQSEINQGIELFNNQEYDSAISKLDAVLQSHPNNSQAREYLQKSKTAQQEVLDNWKKDLNK